MSAPLIGQPVRRKEDFRFITGSGHYTDDASKPGQTHAVFVRSPHAHARIKGIDSAPALAVPDVVAVLTGDDLKADGIQGLICGWLIHSKDGTPMKAGAHPALALGKVRHVGDPVAVVIAETHAAAKEGAERVVVDYEELPAVVAPEDAQKPDAPQLHDEAPANTIYQWELGDAKATTDAFGKATHVVELDIVNNRLIPNAMEPRAAIGEFDSGSGIFTLTATSQNPHVARLVLSAFVQIAPEHKLRVIAPDVGGGFGSKIFIYPEETVCVWAAKRVGRPVKWSAERSESFARRRPWPRSRDQGGAGARQGRQDPCLAREDHRQSRRLHVDFFVVRADLSLCHAPIGPVRHRRDPRRGRRGLHQYGARRCLSWRRPARSDLCRRTPDRRGRTAVEDRSIRVAAAAISSQAFRTKRR